MNNLIILLVLASIVFFLLLSYTCSFRQISQLHNEQIELFDNLTQFNNYRTDPSQTLHLGDNNSYRARMKSDSHLVYYNPYPDYIDFSKSPTMKKPHFVYHTYKGRPYSESTTHETVSPETPTSPFSSPETVSPETPSPAPDTPAPAPDTPAPAPETPTPSPETPAPDTPTPAPETLSPDTPTPAPDTPTPAPETLSPDTPTPAPSSPSPDTPTAVPTAPTPAPTKFSCSDGSTQASVPKGGGCYQSIHGSTKVNPPISPLCPNSDTSDVALYKMICKVKDSQGKIYQGSDQIQEYCGSNVNPGDLLCYKCSNCSTSTPSPSPTPTTPTTPSPSPTPTTPSPVAPTTSCKSPQKSGKIQSGGCYNSIFGDTTVTPNIKGVCPGYGDYTQYLCSITDGTKTYTGDDLKEYCNGGNVTIGADMCYNCDKCSSSN